MNTDLTGLDRLLKMRPVIFEASISLDGFIEGPNGEMDWLVERGDGMFDGQTFFDGYDTMFFGRKAYERIALPPDAHVVLSEEDREFFYLLHGMRKYVFSRRTKHVRGNGMVVCDNLVEEVNRIRLEHGKNILFCGGAEIFGTFVELDLIDEYVLLVHPVLLYGGKSLFADNRKSPDLKLIGKRNLNSGVVMLHYRPANRIKEMTYESRSIQDGRPPHR